MNRPLLDELELANERAIQAADVEPELPAIIERGQRRPLCDNFLLSRYADGRTFTSIIAFDLTRADGAVNSTVINGHPGVYATPNAIYLTDGHFREENDAYGDDQVTSIQEFHIGPTPEHTHYAASGVVPGWSWSDSLDEWYGYLRVATTRYRRMDPQSSTALSILTASPNGTWIRTGAIDLPVSREDATTVQFDEDRAYVAMFKPAFWPRDPLFVLDLHRPYRPVLLGKVKFPGVERYLQRIDSKHWMSIGIDDGIVLQMFDVEHATQPQLLHELRVTEPKWSKKAVRDPLVFNYLSEWGLLALPRTECKDGGITYSGLLVYDVSAKDGFRHLGSVNHGNIDARCDTYWPQGEYVVRRGLFLEEQVWSVGNDKVKVQPIDRLGHDSAELPLAPTAVLRAFRSKHSGRIIIDSLAVGGGNKDELARLSRMVDTIRDAVEDCLKSELSISPHEHGSARFNLKTSYAGVVLGISVPTDGDLDTYCAGERIRAIQFGSALGNRGIGFRIELRPE